MNKIIGMFIMIFGILWGIYLFFIWGIYDSVIEGVAAISKTPIDSPLLALAILKFFIKDAIAALAGYGTFMIGLLIFGNKN